MVHRAAHAAITPQTSREAWHTLAATEVLAQFGSSAVGLSVPEAARRLTADGPNELAEGKSIGRIQILLSQFKSVIIWVLIAAGVISGVLGDSVDAIAILAIVVLNAGIGFYQECAEDGIDGNGPDVCLHRAGLCGAAAILRRPQ